MQPLTSQFNNDTLFVDKQGLFSAEFRWDNSNTLLGKILPDLRPLIAFYYYQGSMSSLLLGVPLSSTFHLGPKVKETYSHKFTFGGDTFGDPDGPVFDRFGNFYVCDTQRHKIHEYKFNYDQGTLSIPLTPPEPEILPPLNPGRPDFGAPCQD